MNRTKKPAIWLLFVALAAIGFTATGAATAAAAAAAVREEYQQLARSLLEDGRIALRDKRFADAKSVLQQALVANPGAPQAFLLLGQVALAEDDAAEANRLIGIALELAPKAQEVLLWAGKAALAKHDKTEAEAHLAQLQSLCAACAMTQELAQALAAYVPPDQAVSRP